MNEKIKKIKLSRFNEEEQYLLNIFDNLIIDENRTDNKNSIAYSYNGKTILLIDIKDKILMIDIDTFNYVLNILQEKKYTTIIWDDEVYSVFDRMIQEYFGWENYNNKRILRHEFKRKFN